MDFYSVLFFCSWIYFYIVVHLIFIYSTNVSVKNTVYIATTITIYLSEQVMGFLCDLLRLAYSEGVFFNLLTELVDKYPVTQSKYWSIRPSFHVV